MKTLFLSALSISGIELINLVNSSVSFFGVLMQIIIFVLTVRKLYLDIKHHKYKSISKTQKDIEKNNKFLSVLIKLFKQTKF